MNVALVVVCGICGVAVGTFLNVLIYRVPRREAIVSRRSHCPRCSTVLATPETIPIVSWLLRRGRCAASTQTISYRYVLVEVAAGALYAAAAMRFGVQWPLPAFLVLIAGLLALACTDAEHYLLPKRIVGPLLGMVGGLLLLAAAVTGDWDHLAVAIACSAGWFAAFFAINRFDSRLLAFGDVRLALVIGLGLGWLGMRDVMLGFLAANLIGVVIGVTLMAARRIKLNARLPYGVFLTLGAYVAIFAGPWLPPRPVGTW